MNINDEDLEGILDNILPDNDLDKLTINSKEYDLKEWVTLSNYCKHHGIKINNLMNRIQRNTFNNENRIVIKELNNLVLVKLND